MYSRPLQAFLISEACLAVLYGVLSCCLGLCHVYLKQYVSDYNLVYLVNIQDLHRLCRLFIHGWNL